MLDFGVGFHKDPRVMAFGFVFSVLIQGSIERGGGD